MSRTTAGNFGMSLECGMPDGLKLCESDFSDEDRLDGPKGSSVGRCQLSQHSDAPSLRKEFGR